jgi:hypothetical protein
LAGSVGGFAADGEAAGVDPVTGFPAAAVAEVGEELVEAAHAVGRTIPNRGPRDKPVAENRLNQAISQEETESTEDGSCLCALCFLR